MQSLAKVLLICMTTAMLVVVAGCESDTLTSVEAPEPAAEEPSDEELLAQLESEVAGKFSTARTNLYTWPPPGERVRGARGYILRHDHGFGMLVKTADLTPYNTYTLWIIGFDAPEMCVDGCGEDEVNEALAGGANAAEVTIFGAFAGTIANRYGRAYFLGLNQPGDDAHDVLVGDGSVDNPSTAEVHIVIRCHGPIIRELLRQQLTRFDGGCEPGDPNEGLCEDVQFGVFLAP